MNGLACSTAPSWDVLFYHFAIELGLLLAVLAAALWVALMARRGQRLAHRNATDKARFLAVMSHEIRTPMNATMAAVELLRRTGLDRRQSDLARLAHNAGAGLLELLDGVLDAARLEADGLDIQPESTDVARLVREVADLHRFAAEAKGLYVQLEIAEPLPRALWVDPVRVRQVISNLLSNAVKFTETGGVRVQLSLRGQADHRLTLHLGVHDSGIGIAPERQGQLFNPFVQADASTTRRYGGTGLGLAICKQLIGLMGGSIGLRSAPGQGTEISVQLPVRRGAQPGAAPQSSSPRPGSTTALKVLVVDDQPLNQQVMALQLKELGHCCTTLSDGAAALAALEHGQFQALLLDCYLPHMDGYEVARRWRAIEQRDGRARLPIIAVSAANDSAHQQLCRESGFDEVLGKPLPLARLAFILAQCTALTPARGADASADITRPLRPQFLLACREDLDELQEALAGHDRQRAIHHAHRLYGASLVMGAETLAEQAGQLEQSLRQGLSWPQGQQRSEGLRALLNEGAFDAPAPP
jgi:two-component system sensor histidine kinase EvgS